MPMRLLMIACLVASTLVGAANGKEPRTVYWNDLRPALPDLESAFSDLTPDQLEAMRIHVKWLTAPAKRKQDAVFRKEAEAALGRLNADGVDVAGLLDRRRQLIVQQNRAAQGPNPDILGADIRVPGYVLPLAFDGRKVTEFLLVPTVGACIHTPAPPPNQIVHVTYPDGFELEGLFEAVWVEGRMEGVQSELEVGYSDGTGQVRTTYSLEAGGGSRNTSTESGTLHPTSPAEHQETPPRLREIPGNPAKIFDKSCREHLHTGGRDRPCTVRGEARNVRHRRINRPCGQHDYLGGNR